MFSQNIVDLRKLFRQLISNEFPFTTTDSIFEKLKKKHLNYLTFKDLFNIIEKNKLDKKDLKLIFYPYGIKDEKISKKKWRSFYEDEFCSNVPSLPIPSTINKFQEKILDNFIESIKKRTNNDISSMWIYLMKFNPQGSNHDKLRLSGLCHLISELDLVVSPEDFLQSIFSFFNKPLDSLTFQEFVKISQTFL